MIILISLLFFGNLLAQPAPISNLSALTGTTLGEIKLSWTYPGPDILPEGSSYYIQHSSYSVEWSPAKAQVIISTGPVNPGEAQSHSIITLIPNTIYFFRIWTSSSADGIFSDISNAATAHSQGPPGRINDLSTTPKFRTAILTWTAPGADGYYYDLFNATFTIRYSSTTQDWALMKNEIKVPTSTLCGSLQIYHVTGLLNQTSYWFLIRTVDSLGYESELSNITTNYSINTPPPSFALVDPDKYIALTPIVTFYWQYLSDPDEPYGDYISSYTLIISTVSDLSVICTAYYGIIPSTFVYNGWTVSSMTIDISDHWWSENTTYYWSVIVYDSESTTNTTVEVPHWFVKNLIPEPPTPPILLQPSNYQFLSTLTTTFLWQESTDPDNDPVHYELVYYTVGFSTTIILTTTYYTPTQQFIDNSSYTWYVIAKDAWGVKNISSVYNFYVNLKEDFPSEPSPLEPQNNFVLTTSTPLILWKTSTDPDPTDSVSYELNLKAYNPWYSATVVYSTSIIVESTSYTLLSTTENYKYEWYVIAKDTSPYKSSSTGTVSKISVFYINITPEPPTKPLLSYPTGRFVIPHGISSPTFKWVESKPVDPLDSVKYILTYKDHISHSTSVVNIYVTSYTPTHELLKNARYSWDVAAISLNNQMINRSVEETFYIDFANEPPYTPRLLNPRYNSVVSTLTPTFEWDRGIPGIDYEGSRQLFPDPDHRERPSGRPLNEKFSTAYRLYYTSDTRLTPVVNFLHSEDTSFTLTTNLTENITYYWWIEIIDNTNLRAVSSTFTFMTNAIEEFPTSPTPITPANNSVLKHLTPTFVWKFSFDPDPTDSIFYILNINEYYPWYSNNLTFSTTLLLTTTSYRITPLKENRKYTWFITAKDTSAYKTSSTGTVSEVYTVYISTYDEPPGDFSLISPKDVARELQPTFKWTPADPVDPLDLITYDLYCYHISGTTVTYKTNITTTVYKPDTILTEGEKYNWYIIARDKRNNKKRSNQKFQILIDAINHPPQKFELLYPSGTVRTTTPKLSWEESLDPERENLTYELRLSVYHNFRYYTSTITHTTSYTPNLIHNTTYYWFVIAKDIAGLSTTTQIWTFYIPPLKFPPPPTDITSNITISGRHKKLIISWKKVDGAKLYRIYFSTTSDIFSLAAEVTHLSYTRILPPNIVHYFYLTTIDEDNVESPPSQIFKITPDGETFIPHLSEDKILTIELKKDVYDEILNNNLTMKIQKIDENKYQLYLATERKIITNYKFDTPFIMIFKFTPIKGKKPAVYHFNGIEYVYRQPTVDIKNCSAKIQSYELGIYKISQIFTPGNFTITNITPPKIFTPYIGADEKASKIKFYYHNPDELTQPSGSVYGIDGTFIAHMKNYLGYLEWDGKYDTGEYVPKGIYIYIITYKDIRKTGTIIVAR